MRSIVGVALAFLAWGPALALVAAAQTPPIQIQPATAPTDGPVYQLYPEAAPDSPATAQIERWERLGPVPGLRDGSTSALMVRNVTTPTLTAYLPDPAIATGAAVIVAPGGGNVVLMYDYEGIDVAKWLAAHGVAAFVLKYRLEPSAADPAEFAAEAARSAKVMTGQTDPTAKDPAVGPASLPSRTLGGDDAQAAVRLLRTRSTEWKIDPNRIGMVGFSAGAGATLQAGLSSDSAARPNFIAPIYGSLAATSVPEDAPPLFTAIGTADPIFRMPHEFGLVRSYLEAGRPIELHLYAGAPHGFGMRLSNQTSDLWIEEFYAWIRAMGFLRPST